VEEPVRRRVNTVAWTGATTAGHDTMRRMRGLSVLPARLDFGVLKEGCTYTLGVSLHNTGIDACRYRVRQPPPGTGIRVLYKPGPVGYTLPPVHLPTLSAALHSVLYPRDAMLVRYYSYLL